MFTYNAKWTWELELNSLCIASRVESTIADGHYKIVPESEGEAQEGEVNVIDANQEPKSLRLTSRKKARLGAKPNSFKIFCNYEFLWLCIYVIGVEWNLSCIFP